jgi:hypothetical protein
MKKVGGVWVAGLVGGGVILAIEKNSKLLRFLLDNLCRLRIILRESCAEAGDFMVFTIILLTICPAEV